MKPVELLLLLKIIKLKLSKLLPLPVLLAAVVLAAASLIISCGSNTSAGSSAESLDQFAACLAEKGAELYGAYWCSHCESQKEMFGPSFAKIKYVECTVEIEKCNEEEISGYPTWKFKDGTSMPGTQSFTVLAVKTGCALP